MRRKLTSIRGRLLFFFIGLSVLQIVVMAGFVKLNLEPSIIEMYTEHLERFADVTLEEMSDESEKIENYMVNIIGDSSIQSFLETANKVEGEELAAGFSAELRNRILAYTDYDNIIRAIYLLDNEGRIYSNLGKRGMQKLLEENPKLSRRREASALWFSKEQDVIAIFRIINNNTTDLTRRIGAICIFIDREEFQDRVNRLMMEENQHYVLASGDRNFLIMSEEDMEIGEGDIVCVKENEGWKLKTWIDKDTAYAPVDLMVRLLLIELLVLLGVSVVLIVYLTGRITKPMKKIRAAMKEIGEGNMDILVPEEEDEMGVLAATLNTMSQNIKELMEQLHEDEKQKRYLELKAMQYQINPHFLYNTLDSITMSARKNHDRQSEAMTMALSEFFRICLSQGMEFVTVETELRYVQSYLEIQSIRFPDSVSWQCMAEPGLEKLKVLKFILQPIVENSLYHGLHDVDRNGDIRIHAFRKGCDLHICVSDNGVGMMPKQLESVRMKIMEKRIAQEGFGQGGIGLQNVQQRLQLVYGTKAGLVIESEWEEGTWVTAVIPGICS